MDYIPRTDQHGRWLSLTGNPPNGQAVLITGAAGMGASSELDHAAAVARGNGHDVIRLRAAGHEPLEQRVVRAVTEQLDSLQQGQRGLRGGRRRMKKLRRTMDDLLVNKAKVRSGADVGTSRSLPVWFGFGRGREQYVQRPETTLSDLADCLNDLATARGTTTSLMVDDLHAASDKDLSSINELSRHSSDTDRFQFVGAGRTEVTSRLMSAGQQRTGITTDITRHYDIRQCQPVADEVLQFSLAQQLARSGVVLHPDASRQLLAEANGSPQRLHELQQSAMAQAQPIMVGGTVQGHRVDPSSAQAAIARVRKVKEPFYQAAWQQAPAAERELLAAVAGRGQRGLPQSGPRGKSGPPGQSGAQELSSGSPWTTVDAAQQKLTQAGWLRQSDGGRLRFADPAMQAWVDDHLGGGPQQPAPPERPPQQVQATMPGPVTPLTGPDRAGRGERTVAGAGRGPDIERAHGRGGRHRAERS